MTGMKVLSLFDGISCGMVALERAKIPVERYVAYEIEKSAIKASKKNYPHIEQCGDVTTADFKQYHGFDLLMGGSPCQDLSNYKYDRGDVKGLEGEKSRLFYHFVRALKECKPRYFLLENVASMEQRWVDVISQELGVEPVAINSALVSAQERNRLYWTNIPGVDQPNDNKIALKDIVVNAEEVPDKYWYSREFTYNGDDKKVQATLLGSGLMRNMRECYNLNNKCNTLLCDGDGGNRQKKVFQDGRSCLWLKGLQLLKHTNEVEPEIIHSKGKSGGYSGPSWYVTDENGKILSWKDPRTAKARSKTYEGVARAMAEQWAGVANE